MLGHQDLGSGAPPALTGKDDRPTLAFARRLAARKQPIWVRFVLVPGLTDDLDDLGEDRRVRGGLGNVERVEVLPFHQLGRFKWERLGLDYTLDDVAAPPRANSTERVLRRFCSRERRVFTAH